MNTRFLSRPFGFARRIVVTSALLIVLGLPGVAIGQSASQTAMHIRPTAHVTHMIKAQPSLAFHKLP